MLSLSDDRYVHCSMSLKVADCVFAGCLLNVSLEMSVPTISSVFFLNTKHKMSSFHVGDSRHVRYDIIFLVPTERVLQVLKFLPFTSSILLWVLKVKILL